MRAGVATELAGMTPIEVLMGRVCVGLRAAAEDRMREFGAPAGTSPADCSEAFVLR